jgi:hypothetical protein
MSDYEQELEQQLNELQDRLTTAERLVEYLYPVWETHKDLVYDGTLTWVLKIGYVNIVRIQRKDISLATDVRQNFDINFIYAETKEMAMNTTLEDLKKEILEKFMMAQISAYVQRTEYINGLR